MRIHIIGINYWPEVTGIAVFSTGRAEFLAERGHRVTMCTAWPYYPQWRVAPEYRRRPFARETRAGVDILRVPIYVPSRVTPLRRVIHEATFIAAAFVRSLFAKRPDILLIVSPPLGLAVVAALLGRVWRAPFVFHVADLQPDAALDLGMVRPGRIARALYALERLAYRRAAAVSTLTEAMRSRIIGKGVDREKVRLFSDWADPELFTLSARADDPELRHELGLGNAFVALHVGNMGVKQGLGVVIDAAARSRGLPDVLYVLVGDGAMRPPLEAQARSLGLSNVRIISLLDRGRFQRLLATADACLVTQQRTVADIVFPSKVLTLLAAGKPVIASVSDGSEVARVVGESGGGTVVAAEDPDALASALARLRSDEALRSRQSDLGRAYARAHWQRDATLAHLADQLEAIGATR